MSLTAKLHKLRFEVSSNKFRYFTFFIFAIIRLNTLGQTPDSIPKDGLLAYWPFNGNALDESGHENHGQVTGAILTIDRYGFQGSAYSFSAQTDRIYLPSLNYMPLNEDFAISFWFRGNQDSRMQPLNINGSNNLNFAFNNEAGCWSYWNSSGFFRILSGEIAEFTDGYWHNLIFVRKGPIFEVYFDGKLRGTQIDDTTWPIGNKDGLYLSDGSYPWIGDIDDVLIYSRGLTSEEIAQLSNQPNISIRSPAITDAYPIGYLANIMWMKPNEINQVNIMYSVDAGKTWNLIESNIDASQDFFVWEVPNLPGSVGLIKVTDSKDSANYDISDPFSISKYKWQLKTQSAGFSIRDGAAAYAFQDQLLLAGGWNPSDPVMYPLVTNNEIWRSHDGIDWELIAHAPWEPRHTFGRVVYRDKMWVLGGDQLQCGYQTDVWSSLDGINWDLVSSAVPWGERMVHMYSVFNDKIWIMGGQKIAFCGEQEEAYNDVWNSADGVNWNLVTDAAPWSPRGQISGYVVFNDKMWILGGGVYQSQYYNDIWNSPDGVNWNLVLEEAPWKNRQYHAVGVFDEKMWVLQGNTTYGSQKKDLNDVWYSEDGLSWYQLIGTPWMPRHAASIFAQDSSLTIAAGFLWNDVWQLNIQQCPKFEIQPESQEVLQASTANLAVYYPTPGASYQWQTNTGHGWEDLMDGNDYDGVNTANLNIRNIKYENHNQQYRCIASEGVCSDTSNVAILRISDSAILFPNPAKDNIILQVGSDCLHCYFEIVDLTGRVLFKGQTNGEINTIDISDFPAGFYLVSIPESNQAIRFIKSSF